MTASDDKQLVAVIGAGVMGTGVAHSLAQHGFSTLVVDVDEGQLATCAANMRRNLRLYRFHEEHVEVRKPVDRILAQVELTTDLTRVVAASLVIENVTESWPVKRSLYRELNGICSRETILAVNTSAIPITRIADEVDAPERVLGAHFMNPVPLMPLVEVIRTPKTGASTLERFAELLRGIGKRYVLVEDSPGFVTNRAMMLFVNEAICMLQEGLCDETAIDTLFRGCFGHKMGPLQTADLIGLDTVLHSLEVLYDAFGDEKYRPSERLCEMVRAGLLGVKSGRGFYDYPYMGGGV